MSIDRITAVVSALIIGALLYFAASQSYAPAAQRVLATDVSWPNCTTLTPKNLSIGVVGVTGGLNFHQNHCLYDEAKWFTRYALYINTGYPGPDKAGQFSAYPHQCADTELTCLAYNYGYAAGHYAVDYANSKGVHSTLWWLDVETSNSWTTDPLVNRAALRGTYDAVRHFTFATTIGYYSYPLQWQKITGNWQNGKPAWVATGTFSPSAALAACQAPAFNGGRVWLSQYTQGLDKNFLCSSDFRTTIDKLK